MVDREELRRQAVLNTLRTSQGMTIEEIAEKMQGNYYTIRKSLLELQDLGLAHKTGMIRDRRDIWAAGEISSIPELYDPSNNRRIPIDEIAVAAEQGTPASVRAASAFFESLQQLVAASVQLADGASLNPDELKKVRYALISNQSYLKNLLGYYAQLLSIEDLWTIEGLATIGIKIKEKRS